MNFTRVAALYPPVTSPRTASTRFATLIAIPFVILAMLALILSASAHAIGLGRLSVLSSLGQPLRAEIELTSLTAEEAATLSVKIASPDAFSQANLEYGALLSSLRLSVERRPNGKQFIRINSTQPANEPFVDLLLELNWSSGRLMREYTFLLDPPDIVMAKPAPTVSAASAAAVTRPAPATTKTDASRRTAPTPSAAQASSTTGGEEYTVQRGDTLAKVAREFRPDNASLDQMLVALYRNNPSAFDGNNMNRLRSGAILQVPDAASVQSVDAQDARRVVAAQTSDYSAYRSRIAETAVAGPVPSPVESKQPAQSASGKITAKVEDKGVPASTQDQLKLSKASAAAKTPTGAAASITGKTGPTAEDLAARDRAVREANERVALLEKNIADLQALMKLKDQRLAELQRQLETAAADKAAGGKATSPPVTPAAPAPAGQAVSPPADQAPAAKPVAPPAAAPKPVAPATPAASQPEPEEGMLTSLLNNPMVLGVLALLALGLLGYVFYLLRRKRNFSRFEDSVLAGGSALRANSVFGTTGGQSVDTSNSNFNSSYVPGAPPPSENEVDPIAEADVYIAYGRDAQAEEILKEALRNQPERNQLRVKLLEIYARRKDVKAFASIAAELQAKTGGESEDWKTASALGKIIDPDNPLYKDGDPQLLAGTAFASAAPDQTQPLRPDVVAEATAGALQPEPPALDLDLDLTAASQKPAEAGGAVQTAPVEEPPAPLNLDFDLGLPASAAAPAAPQATPTASAAPGPMDFDLDLSAPTITQFPAQEPPKPSPPPQEPMNFESTMALNKPIAPTMGSETEIAGNSVDFSLDLPSVQPVATGGTALDPQNKTTILNEPFAGINLDLDTGAVSAPDAPASTGDKTQEMATKLDLAIAYKDIGDKDGARDLLNEVIRNGDPAQVEKARELLSGLG